METLNTKKVKILKCFMSSNNIIPFYDLSKKTSLDWHTCNKYCKALCIDGYLVKKGKNLYRLRLLVLNKLKRQRE